MLNTIGNRILIHSELGNRLSNVQTTGNSVPALRMLKLLTVVKKVHLLICGDFPYKVLLSC